MYIAHFRSSDAQYQSVKEHLIETCKIAEEFGEKLNIKHVTGLAGLLHDLGKYSDQFKEYLLAAVANPEAPPKRGSVDHATAGAKLLHLNYHKKEYSPVTRILVEIVGNAIMSHHGYLHDYITPDLQSKYLDRINKEITDFEKIKKRFYKEVMTETQLSNYVSIASKELKSFLDKTPSINQEKSLMFLTKFVFSTLIDADRTNTRLFEENSTIDQFHHEELFSRYYKILLDKLNTFESDTKINQLRKDMSIQCDIHAHNPSDIYTLSIPTGGGKTFASLRYALKHALFQKKKRIIYILPYTTIIEQNAKEVRNILQDEENILEHHANVIFDDYDDEHDDGINSQKRKLKLAKDNWDSPIIFTTMVQFLNVFYAHGNRYTRRLHNLVDSVLIFDEVQKVPVKCITLFNEALNFLKKYGNSSILLCTATQPALDFVETTLNINPNSEIIADIDKVVSVFKRVDIIDKTESGPITTLGLANFIISQTSKHNNQLIILNTKNVVRKLYQTIKNKELNNVHIYHLSTSMCGAHRTKILNEIKCKLAKNKKVICISTQLIEAGVDISFESVIRSLSGLDSIAQAAGRCNRNGEKDKGYVYIIEHKEESLSKLREIEVGKNISKKILIDLRKNSTLYGGDLLSRQAMTIYFRNYYAELSDETHYFIKQLKCYMKDLLFNLKIENELIHAYQNRYKQQLRLFMSQSHKTAAKYFNVIDNQTTSVIVPYEEGQEIITDLISSQSIDQLSVLLRRAQNYTINLYDQEVKDLMRNGGLFSAMNGDLLIIKDWAYSNEYGLDLSGEGGNNSYLY